jgi:hypothetical protein
LGFNRAGGAFDFWGFIWRLNRLLRSRGPLVFHWFIFSRNRPETRKITGHALRQPAAARAKQSLFQRAQYFIRAPRAEWKMLRIAWRILH